MCVSCTFFNKYLNHTFAPAEEGVAVSDGVAMTSALEGGIDQSLLATLRELVRVL